MNTFAEICQSLGKPSAYIRSIQAKLGLHVPKDESGYSEAYVLFLQNIVALRTFSVPMDEIVDLFNTEKKLLRLLKVDTLSRSPTWYLDQCGKSTRPDSRLLLTNYDLGGAITSTGVQSHLDFSQHTPELFAGVEMGEDARKILKTYQAKRTGILVKVRSEEPVLKQALQWSKQIHA